MKIIKLLGIVLLIFVLFVIVLVVFLSLKPFVPNNYTTKVITGSEIEAKYLGLGKYAIRDIKIEGSELTKNYYIYYPKELKRKNQKYPVVVTLNGTGVLPKKYKALFQHLASWGFVVIGNEDASTGFGKSSDETIDFIININEDQNSIFYKKLDLENIGIIGHSQGGAGVFTAISIMEHKDMYKTAVSLSPTHEEMAHAFGWNYDLTQVSIPTFMVAGTEGEFETDSVIPIEKMIDMYNKIPSLKVMMRRIGADHGQMLYFADGYVTAWLMWQLQIDEEASEAFVGDNPELFNNKLYQDQRVDINGQQENKKIRKGRGR